MKFHFFAAIFCVTTALSGNAYADFMRDLGLEYVDAKGCSLKVPEDEKPVGTLYFFTSLYAEPGTGDEEIMEILKTALKNGCPVNEFDEGGITPLNAAIVYNQPELVELFLSSGADPFQIIAKTGEEIDGLNSFGLMDFMSRYEPDADWQALKKILSEKQPDD